MNAAAIDPTQTPSMKEATMFTDEMPKRTAVSYIRVSTTDQATRGGLAEGLSIPAQRQAIAAKAQSIDALSSTSSSRRANLARPPTAPPFNRCWSS